jgi:hypothetical protein
MIPRFVKATVVLGLWLEIAAFGQDAARGAGGSSVSSDIVVLQPAVMSLLQTMDSLRVEKWKASKEAKAETAENIGSIRRDVEATLPGLITAAGAAPGSLAALLSLSRNVGALYDVLLRVTVIAESAAPGDQAEALKKALNGVDAARRTLADRQQYMAAAEEEQIGSMRKQLSAAAAAVAVCPPAVPAAPVKTASKAAPKRRKKGIKPAVKDPSTAVQPAGSGTS